MRCAAVALAIVGLVIACDGDETRPATQLLVTVDSDLQIGSELTDVRVDIGTADGDSVSERHTFKLTASKPKEDEVQLPFSFGVAKRGQDAFQLRVAGLKGDAIAIDIRWNVQFEAEKTLGFSAFLGSACAGTTCEETETCYPRRRGNIAAGACAKVPMASTSPVAPGDELPQIAAADAGKPAGRGGAGGAGAAAAAAGRSDAGGAGVSGNGRAAGGSGACATQLTDYFADSDGDGHGDPSMKRSVCGAAPAGFVTSGDDCCDSDNRAFPGQLQGDVTASTCSELGFDFDCDGTEEIGWPHLQSGTCCADDEQEGWKDAIPECGASGQFTRCNAQCQPESSTAKQRCY
jgi:hypothetical protein